MTTINQAARRLLTKLTVGRLFNVAQLSSYEGRQTKLTQLIEKYIKQGELTSANILPTAINRLATEQPTKEALWTFENKNDEYKILTFGDIYKQSCRLANALTGKSYHLQSGQSVLVILPETVQERILLLLACLQSGLVFCPCDPTVINEIELSRFMQRLRIDCVITDYNNMEKICDWTQNPLRPLKKGVIMRESTSKLLPVGWNNLMGTAADADSHYENKKNIDSDMPVLRFISNNNNVIQYSHETLSLRLLLTALWLSNERIPRLIWMKNRNEIISIAPWLFGSSIMYKEVENSEEMFRTFEEYPIDAFCASMNNYQTFDNEKQENKTQLEQLFSFEPINPNIKALWYAVTNLDIHDDYAEFNNTSMLKYFSNSVQRKQDPIYEELSAPLSFSMKHKLTIKK